MISYESRIKIYRKAGHTRALKEMFQGGRPLIFVCTPEEGRVRMLLQEVADRLFAGQMPVWSWSLTSGLQHPDGRPAEKLSPQAVLEFIAAHKEPGIFQLKDFHQFMCDDPGIRRRLRDLYELCMDSGKFIVITSPLRLIPEELNRQIALVELHAPGFWRTGRLPAPGNGSDCRPGFRRGQRASRYCLPWRAPCRD